MSGSMTLGNYRSTTVDLGSRHEEERDATGRGSIRLYLPDRDLVGEAEVRFAASILPTIDGISGRRALLGRGHRHLRPERLPRLLRL